MQINTHHAFSPSATATASATVAEVFLSTATASATAQKSTFGRPLVKWSRDSGRQGRYSPKTSLTGFVIDGVRHPGERERRRIRCPPQREGRIRHPETPSDRLYVSRRRVTVTYLLVREQSS